MTTVAGISVANEAGTGGRPGDSGRAPGVLRAILRSPRGVTAAVFLTLTVVACAFASFLAPADPLADNLPDIEQGPSLHHLLGTDELGRDILSRLLVGGQSSLLGVAEAVAVLLVLGVSCGVVAGYRGGLTDKVISRIADVLMAIPVIIILLAVLSIFGSSLLAAMVTFGILSAAGLARVVRSSALATREELYVAAARILGLPGRQIIVRHILPRARGVIVVQASLFAAIALGVQTGLTYLSLGPPPPAPTWGGMVAEAATHFYTDPWMLVPSGAAIALTVLALGILGDVARDTLADAQSGSHGRPPRATAAQPGGQPPVDPSALLTVRNLRVAVAADDGPVTVVDGFSLQIGAGEAIGIVGESGCGKSMTARAIPGLLPRNAGVTSGSVWFDGQELTGGGRDAYDAIRGHGIGIVSQEPMRALDPTFRVGSVLADIVRAVDKVGRAAARRRALALLEQVRIAEPAEVARRYPHEISGGMAQRVAIALALAGRPKLLIADEPTTALDVTVQAEILDLLRSLQRETGMALLLISHDLGVVSGLCPRVVVMYAGQVVEEADTLSLFSQPAHPYTRALLAASPHRSREGGRLATIPGVVPNPREWPAGCHFAGRCPMAGQECLTGPIELRPRSGADGTARCVRLGATPVAEGVSR